MPIFSRDACDRIGRAVRTVETRFDDNGGPHGRYSGDQPLLWLVLTANLAAATGSSPLTPATASANPANWDATANSGAGGYTIDTSTTLTVVEATGQRSFASGTWLLCRPLGSNNGMLWEPVEFSQGGALRHGTLAAALSVGNSNASVTLGGSTVAAKNLMCESGAASAACIVMPNDAASSPSDPPWILVRVLPTVKSFYVNPGYDETTGSFTSQQISLGVVDQGGPQTATAYVAGSSASSDLQRDSSTTGSVSVSPSSPVYGQSFTLSATVTGQSPGVNTPTGNVQFWYGPSGGSPVGFLAVGALSGSGMSATATVTYNAGSGQGAWPPAGSYAITAYYLGDDDYNASDGSGGSLTVGQASVTVTLGASPTTGAYGTQVVLTASVVAASPESGIPTGTITFYDGSTALGTLPVAYNGNTPTPSVLPTTQIQSGSQSLTAVYNGDGNFNTGTSSTVTASLTKVGLVVTAANQTCVHGGVIPTFAYAVTGFVNGETAASVVTGTPTLTCSAGSPGGTAPTPGTLPQGYPIVPAVGTLTAANYSFGTFTNGMLTVT
jgi:hypothetical protein